MKEKERNRNVKHTSLDCPISLKYWWNFNDITSFLSLPTYKETRTQPKIWRTTHYNNTGFILLILAISRKKRWQRNLFLRSVRPKHGASRLNVQSILPLTDQRFLIYQNYYYLLICNTVWENIFFHSINVISLPDKCIS